MTCRLDRIVGARELATAVAARIRSAQDETNQHSKVEGDGLPPLPLTG